MISRIWREGAGTLIVAFALLDLSFLGIVPLGNPEHHDVGSQLFWLALDAFLLWRVWNHSNFARGALFVIALLAAGLWIGTGLVLSAYGPLVLAISAVQVAILLSPAIRKHVGELKTGDAPAS